MLKYFMFIFSFLIVSYLPAQSLPRFINVVGTAQLNIEADQIMLSINIKTIEETLEESKITNEKTIIKLINILKTFTKEEKYIELTPMTFGINYIFEDGKNIKDGYYSSVQISFTLNELDKYYNLINDLIQTENISITNSQYNNSLYEKYNQQTYENAILLAKEKAQYLANKANVKLGRVIEIGDNSNASTFLRQSYPNPFNASTSISSSSKQIFGSIKINRSVRVKYELID